MRLSQTATQFRNRWNLCNFTPKNSGLWFISPASDLGSDGASPYQPILRIFTFLLAPHPALNL
jgi:hypothetical protein